MMTMESLKFAFGATAALVALWFVGVRLGRFLSWVERSEIARQQAEAAERGKVAAAAAPPAAAPAIAAREGEGVPPRHVAAIAAAVAAYGYRVVHIADTASGRAWAAEGRWLHQTSHHTH
jgi:hypothetical protein